MDYSKQVEASEAADFAYAEWYNSLPDERKAQIFLDGFNLVAKKIREDQKRENPLSATAEIVLRFIELTQKDDYPPATFAFIREKMLERAEEEWRQRFRAMKKALGWTYDDIARYMGASGGASVKSSISRKLPAFAKLAVCVFEHMSATIAEIQEEKP
jgi:hypothetical protein